MQFLIKFCYLALLAVNFVNGDEISFKILVDGQHKMVTECPFARSKVRSDDQVIRSNLLYVLDKAQSRINTIVKKLMKTSPSVEHSLVSSVCDLELDNADSVNERLWFLRRAAVCLNITTVDKNQVMHFLKDAICSLERIARQKNSVCSLPNQRDVISWNWRTRNLQKAKLKEREIRILNDVRQAVGKLLQVLH